MLKKLISRCAIVLNAVALMVSASAFASPTEVAIENFLNSGMPRHLAGDTSMLNADGVLGDFIILPNGDYLVIGLDMSGYMGPPGPLDIMYIPAAMPDLETTMALTNDLMFIGKGPYAASVINRTVDSQPFCAFDTLPDNGFVAASRIPAGSGMAMVNGMPVDLDIELTVVPGPIASSWPMLGMFIGVPNKACKLNLGCPAVNCTVKVHLFGGIYIGKNGTCTLGTRLFGGLACPCKIF